VVVRSAEDLQTVLQALDESTAVGLDCETTGLTPRRDRIRLLTLATERGTYVIDCFAVDPRSLFGTLAERPLIAHNAVFDLGFLSPLGFVPSVVHDTMLLSQLLHGTRKAKGFHGLARAAEREIGRAMSKDLQRSCWSCSLSQDQLDYAAEDAAVLLPLFHDLTAKIKAAALQRVAEIERRCLPAMAWLARSGVAVDRAAWEELATQAEQEVEALAQQLDDIAPARDGYLSRAGAWNWSSVEQTKEAFSLLGIPLDKTDDDALAAVDHPLAELLRKHRAASKLVGTYGRDWLSHVADDGRVYGGWRQIGSDAGRMSCREPNLQQLPRDKSYRRCIVAPPGRVLGKADYSQLQLRIAARIANDRNMQEAYARGDDLHTVTARTITGKQEVSQGDRQLAKAINFGLLFGLGAKGLRGYARSNYGVMLTEDEAKRYRTAFFDTYPGLARWHRQAGKETVKECRTLAGRRRVLNEKTPYTHRLNTPVQGTEADGLKTALALLWERRAEVPGAFPVLAVHDELVIECDPSQADAASAWLRQAMLDGMAPLIDPVPVEVEVRVGRTWGGD
jgi:DNA polymerase-1